MHPGKGQMEKVVYDVGAFVISEAVSAHSAKLTLPIDLLSGSRLCGRIQEEVIYNPHPRQIQLSGTIIIMLHVTHVSETANRPGSC